MSTKSPNPSIVRSSCAQLEAHPESDTRPPEPARSRYRQIVEPPCRVIYRCDGKKVFVPFVMRSEQLLRKSVLESRE